MDRQQDGYLTQQTSGDNQILVRPRDARQDRWYFTPEQLAHSPSVQAGMEPTKELWYRYQCADLIQIIGNKLGLLQIAVNTAVLYMHRFYHFHSLTRFHRNTMAPVFIFLAAKVEGQHRRLEHVVRTAHRFINSHEQPPANITAEKLQEDSETLVTHENILLQTLAFDIRVEHPHTHVISLCNITRCDRVLSHAAYALATCALHFTQLCIQYRPVLVACMCVHVAARWSGTEIARSETGQSYFSVLDPTITEQQVQRVADDFLAAIELYPEKNQKKIWKQVLGEGIHPGGTGSGTAGAVAKPEASGSATMGAGNIVPPPRPVAGHALPPSLPVTSGGHYSGARQSVPGGVKAPPPPHGNASVSRPPPTIPKHPVPPPPPAAHRPQAPPPPPPLVAGSHSSGAKPREGNRPASADVSRRSGVPISDRMEINEPKRSRDGEMISSRNYPPAQMNSVGHGRPSSATYADGSDGAPCAKRAKKDQELSGPPEHVMRA